jgi:hypothetical protein
MLLLAGCQPAAGPESQVVTGTVTLDGEPVAAGEIVFRATDGQTRSCGGQITNGQYSFEASPGSKTVEITAMREVPGKMDTSNPGVEVPLMEQYVPEKYNVETTLTAEVSGADPIDFELTSE